MDERDQQLNRSFVDRLEHLFRTVHRHGGRPWSNRSVAEALTSQGHPISHTQIGNLRSGRRQPRHSDTIALARLFGQQPTYFTDDTSGMPGDIDPRICQAIGDAGVRTVALRLADAQLSEAGVQAVLAMIEQVRRLEAARDGQDKDQAGTKPSR